MHFYVHSVFIFWPICLPKWSEPIGYFQFFKLQKFHFKPYSMGRNRCQKVENCVGWKAVLNAFNGLGPWRFACLFADSQPTRTFWLGFLPIGYKYISVKVFDLKEKPWTTGIILSRPSRLFRNCLRPKSGFYPLYQTPNFSPYFVPNLRKILKNHILDLHFFTRLCP